MAVAQRYTDADFAMFEPASSVYDRNAARKVNTIAPNKQAQQPDIRLLPKKKKSLVDAKLEMHAAAKKSAKIICFAFFFLTMFAMLLYSHLRVDELTRDINNTNAMLTQAQGENVRLNMTLDSMISLEKVEDYAKNTLGMTKVEGYQIEYVDLSQEDQVVKSSSKKVLGDEKTSFLQKLKAYLTEK